MDLEDLRRQYHQMDLENRLCLVRQILMDLEDLWRLFRLERQLNLVHLHQSDPVDLFHLYHQMDLV